jgi:predicted nucleic acid-binding Zn ribbon protein
MSWEPLKHILSRSVSGPGASKDFQIARIFEIFRNLLQKIWGEEKAAYVSPVSYKEGVLKLETTSPAAKQQIALDEQKLKNELNRQLGKLVVKSIVVARKGF